jgi:hypothetical protein
MGWIKRSKPNPNPDRMGRYYWKPRARRKAKPIPNPRALTYEEVDARKGVNRAERDALRAMRDLEDFDTLCRLSEALLCADRVLERRNAKRERSADEPLDQVYKWTDARRRAAASGSLAQSSPLRDLDSGALRSWRTPLNGSGSTSLATPRLT